MAVGLKELINTAIVDEAIAVKVSQRELLGMPSLACS